MSSELYRADRRTTIFSPSSLHSRTDPGPMPSLRRTSAGTEICPCAVTLERANAMPTYYHGNGLKIAGQRRAHAAHTSSPTPEPSTLLLLGSGLLLTAHFARRRPAGNGGRDSKMKA